MASRPETPAPSQSQYIATLGRQYALRLNFRYTVADAIWALGADQTSRAGAAAQVVDDETGQWNL